MPAKSSFQEVCVCTLPDSTICILWPFSRDVYDTIHWPFSLSTQRTFFTASGHMWGDRSVKESDGEPWCVKYSVMHTLEGPVKTPFAQHCVTLEKKCIALQGQMNWSSDPFSWKCILFITRSSVSDFNTLQVLYGGNDVLAYNWQIPLILSTKEINFI